MKTSYYGRAKQITWPDQPVAISRGIPYWYRGRVMQELAPTRAMLALPNDEFEAQMRARLDALNPQEIAEKLGPNAVLLCWEKPFDRCHRRMVAEWLEEALGIEIPELGYTRSETPAYATMHPKAPAPQPKSQRGPVQMTLL